MKLNKSVELGVNVVNLLKGRMTPTQTAVLATEVGTTTTFLGQIMRSLRVAGVVSVKRGPGGGYFLGANKTVTVYDVALALNKVDTATTTGTVLSNTLRQSIVGVYRNMTI